MHVHALHLAIYHAMYSAELPSHCYMQRMCVFEPIDSVIYHLLIIIDV